MQISYKPLWRLLVDREMNKKELREVAQISTNTMTRLSKNQSVTLEMLRKICIALNCDLVDVVEFVRTDE